MANKSLIDQFTLESDLERKSDSSLANNFHSRLFANVKLFFQILHLPESFSPRPKFISCRFFQSMKILVPLYTSW